MACKLFLVYRVNCCFLFLRNMPIEKWNTIRAVLLITIFSMAFWTADEQHCCETLRCDQHIYTFLSSCCSLHTMYCCCFFLLQVSVSDSNEHKHLFCSWREETVSCFSSELQGFSPVRCATSFSSLPTPGGKIISSLCRWLHPCVRKDTSRRNQQRNLVSAGCQGGLNTCCWVHCVHALPFDCNAVMRVCSLDIFDSRRRNCFNSTRYPVRLWANAEPTTFASNSTIHGSCVVATNRRNRWQGYPSK